jgi:outer membrane lipoprotein carrier protein
MGLGRSTGLLLSLLLAAPLFAADVDISRTLKGIEEHYNTVKGLQVTFTETYAHQGRKQTEKGELFLKKPGKMRWQYTTPAGKLFVSDGKFIYLYTPEENRYEKLNLKETDDMKAPLAFLLGRLNFRDDFREFRSTAQGADISITAIPKSDKLPYTEVTFIAAPDFSIRKLIVKGQDQSVMDFTFENEKKNPPVQDAMFRFTPPPGVEFVDSSKQ